MRIRANLAATLLLGMTLKLSLPDFIAMQRLDDDTLRKRLRLPASCEPVMAAMRRTPRGRISVLVTCAGDVSEGRGEAVPSARKRTSSP